MIKKIVLRCVLCLLVVSCTKQNTLIALNRVGDITNNTTLKQLESIFKNNKVVDRLKTPSFKVDNLYVSTDDTYLVCNEDDKILLAITPVNALDVNSTIKSITVFDHEFKTKGGVNVLSSFAELQMHHSIEKLEASFSSVTVFVKDINTTFTMDKKDIGLDDFKLGTIIESQIPENTRFTSMTVWLQD